MRALRCGEGHVVDSRCAERIAAKQSRERHPAAGPQPEPFDRLVAIDRAGRQVPAIVADQRRERVAVEPDQCAAEIGAGAGARPRWEWNSARRLNASWALCCDRERGIARFRRREPQVVVSAPYFPCFLGAVQQVPVDDLYSPDTIFMTTVCRNIRPYDGLRGRYRGLLGNLWGLGKEPD